MKLFDIVVAILLAIAASIICYKFGFAAGESEMLNEIAKDTLAKYPKTFCEFHCQ